MYAVSFASPQLASVDAVSTNVPVRIGPSVSTSRRRVPALHCQSGAAQVQAGLSVGRHRLDRRLVPLVVIHPLDGTHVEDVAGVVPLRQREPVVALVAAASTAGAGKQRQREENRERDARTAATMHEEEDDQPSLARTRAGIEQRWSLCSVRDGLAGQGRNLPPFSVFGTDVATVKVRTVSTSVR